MKSLTLAIMIFLLVIQVFGKWAILLEYAINKDFISQNLCENRFKPKSSCEGKCQLAKTMAQEENEKSPGKHQPKVNFTEVLYSVWSNEQEEKLLTWSKITYPKADENFLSNTPSFAVFRPPID